MKKEQKHTKTNNMTRVTLALYAHLDLISYTTSHTENASRIYKEMLKKSVTFKIIKLF